MFSIYMRFFLTPLSHLTWANLNHTLCSVENDPWKKTFNMGNYYFFWAEFYLFLPSFIFHYFTLIVSRRVRKIIGSEMDSIKPKFEKDLYIQNINLYGERKVKKEKKSKDKKEKKDKKDKKRKKSD